MALTTALLLGISLLSGPVWAADFIVSNKADSGAGSLRQAIIDSNAAGGSNTITMNNSVGTITLTSGDLPTIASNVTIVGNNNTLSGGGTYRGLFIGAFSGATQTAVSVSISDLTITNTGASGGAGGYGGGEAGLVTAGTSSSANGSAFGSGLFLQGNGTATVAPGPGQSQAVSNAIADQTGSGGTGANAGSYILSMTGSGPLMLSAVNSYSGGTRCGFEVYRA